MLTAYKKGLASEHACISKLILAGHAPCLPVTGGESYDIALIQNCQSLKIQVKSTRVKSGNKYEVSIAKGRSNKTLYADGEVDYFACHIVPEDMWFIIPQEAANGRKKIRIDPKCPEHEFFDYKEDWSFGNDTAFETSDITPITKKRYDKKPPQEKPVWSVSPSHMMGATQE